MVIYYQGIFSWLITLRQPVLWQKMAQSPLNGTTQPLDSEEEGQSPTTDSRWLIGKKLSIVLNYKAG